MTSSRYLVGNDDHKGRLAVASHSLSTGTLLLTSSAYASVSLSACNWCFTLSGSLKRCGGCQQVRYCSRHCQSQDWASGAHGSECVAWKAIPQGRASQTVLLVARLASRLFLSLTPQPQDQELLALRHHYDDHTPEKLKEFEEMAQLVLVILSRSKRNVSGLSFEALQLKYEREIVLLFCRVNCNAFTICDDVNVPTGVGMFPQAAMLNHSCVPNCVVSFEAPQTLKIHVIRPVPLGEELTISYVELLQSTRKRQASLQASYFFQCACVRCQASVENETEDWLLDGFVCENTQCKGGNSVVILQGEDAVCQSCGGFRDVASIDKGLKVVALRDGEDSQDPEAAWVVKQELWKAVRDAAKCHPRSTLYATTARSIGNFLIDNAQHLPLDSTALAFEFLDRERLATEWILPEWPLPSRGLLYFQLAKLSSQLLRKEDAKSYIHQALAILSCAYGGDHRLVHAAHDLLRDL